MLTQREWVEGCYAYYAENGYEPGNPEDGIWEDAHYPVPKCEGGEATIKLLKQHHAVQGVLQSEEYQRPCIWGWEADYLEGEMLDLCEKWVRTKAQKAAPLGAAALTREQQIEAARKGREALTPEQLRENGRRGQAVKMAKTTPEQRSEEARLREAAKSPEERAERARKAAATYRRRKAAEAEGCAT